MDPGTRALRVRGEIRSSILIYPEAGRLPFRLGARAKLAAFFLRVQSAFDGPKQRPLGERCIVGFGSTGGPPMLPVLYNNNYRIVQSPGHVMILVEMNHDARIIRMDTEHLPDTVRPWLGDTVGHWDGDTLVVETTNFHPGQSFRAAIRHQLHMTPEAWNVAGRRLFLSRGLCQPSGLPCYSSNSKRPKVGCRPALSPPCRTVSKITHWCQTAPSLRPRANRGVTAMSVQLNHTIVPARNKVESASFLTELLGLQAPVILEPFAIVTVGETSLDFTNTDAEIHPHHYAFLVTELKFDQIFARIRERDLTYWADPSRKKAGQINTWDGGRGVYWDDLNGHLLEIITRPYGSGGSATDNPHPLVR